MCTYCLNKSGHIGSTKLRKEEMGIEMSKVVFVFSNRKVLHKGLNIFQSALHFYAYVIKQISMVVENNVGVLYRCLSVSGRYQLISVRQLLIINTPPIIQSNKLTVKSPSSCPPVI